MSCKSPRESVCVDFYEKCLSDCASTKERLCQEDCRHQKTECSWDAYKMNGAILNMWDEFLDLDW